ncbi:MAG: methyltransferase domain-containing protein [Bdellovibrionaceae bacterium]|nr:methyltransferase domain-containing protein [Pseudobdellovibrionaceae bacterium]
MKTQVKDYYGKTLKTSEDLKTNACCTNVDYPKHIKKALGKIHDEVMTKYYGCGLTIPTHLEALKVLDLGSGSGRDCYLLSQIVGENGYVVGVDMTPEQLAVAKKYLDFHKENFGYKKSNVEFIEGDIQNLRAAGLKENDFDLIVSNCVVNLVPDKESVLKEAFSLLKEGGEFYFSDVYCSRRLPQTLTNDSEIWGECLGGAMYWNDFENLAKKVGFTDPRVVETSRISINNPKLQEKLSGFEFYSVTYRLFKISQLETHCEDYGQAVIYKGGVKEQEQVFILDNHHTFYKGKVASVCGNSYRMLHDTRYKENFEFIGNWAFHYGIYEGCGVNAPFAETKAEGNSAATNCC